MGKFSGKVKAEFNPPRRWALLEPLSYRADELTDREVSALEKVGVTIPNKVVTAPTKFLTDLASVPRICWSFIAPWDIARAAIIHDFLYKTIRQYRWNNAPEDHIAVKRAKTASDTVFLMGMRDADPPVPKWKIYLAYKAVHFFGNNSITPTKSNI